jgi:hypothetical protein
LGRLRFGKIEEEMGVFGIYLREVSKGDGGV